MSYLIFIIINMKDKVIVLVVVMLYSSITTEKIKDFNSEIINSSENMIDIVVAEDFWDYLARFTINTE